MTAHKKLAKEVMTQMSCSVIKILNVTSITTTIAKVYDDINTYLMSKEHIIYNFLVNDRSLIHQSVDFPPGSTFLNPLEQEDEAIDRAKKNIVHMLILQSNKV